MCIGVGKCVYRCGYIGVGMLTGHKNPNNHHTHIPLLTPTHTPTHPYTHPYTYPQLLPLSNKILSSAAGVAIATSTDREGLGGAAVRTHAACNGRDVLMIPDVLLILSRSCVSSTTLCAWPVVLLPIPSAVLLDERASKSCCVTLSTC